jgi:hypothetical protein
MIAVSLQTLSSKLPKMQKSPKQIKTKFRPRATRNGLFVFWRCLLAADFFVYLTYTKESDECKQTAKYKVKQRDKARGFHSQNLDGVYRTRTTCKETKLVRPDGNIFAIINCQ